MLMLVLRNIATSLTTRPLVQYVQITQKSCDIPYFLQHILSSANKYTGLDTIDGILLKTYPWVFTLKA